MKIAQVISFSLLSLLSSAQLRFNEIQINNAGTISDFEGDYEDWIEIRNLSASSINLNGYYLTDNPSALNKWMIPSVSISAGGYLLVFASGKNKITPELHTNFKLNSGEKLLLYSPAFSLLDSITLPDCPKNNSYGRNTSQQWVYFGIPTPNSVNNTTSYWGFFHQPTFSLSSGYYSDSIILSISHYDPTVEIRYTLNGTEPTPNSTLYTGPITLKSRIGEANSFSTIPTNPSFNYPIGGYDSIRANNRGWLPPYAEIFKANTVRARVFGSGLPSIATTATYIIGPSLHNRFSLPVLSIIADSLDFFGHDRGIYVYGNAADGNYNMEGQQWERPVFVEYFDETGARLLSVNCGVEMHGGGGRHSTQKNLELLFKNVYGPSEVQFNLYPFQVQNPYARLYVRAGGHRPDCLPRDDLAAKMVERLPMDYMSQRQCIVLLNGEYWGIHTIKELFNKNYFSSKYKIPEEQISIVDRSGDITSSNNTDSIRFKDLIDFISTADMTIASNYDYVKTQIDLDNYLSYMCSQIFIGNGDWPNSNTKIWRKSIPNTIPNASSGHDGKWRWIFYDLDGGFGGTCNAAIVTMNGVQQATLTSPLFFNSTKIFRGLLTNEDFKNAFINRMCDLLNSWFVSDRTRNLLNEIRSLLAPEILEHVERWRYPSTATTLADRMNEVPTLDKWNLLGQQLDSFLIRRPYYQRMHLKNYFTLADSAYLTIQVSDTLHGMVKLNSILINAELAGISGASYPFTGQYFEGLPIPLKAIPLPGYRFKEWENIGLTTEEITVTIIGDTTFTALFEVDPTYDPLLNIKINEIMAKNSTAIRDEFGEYDDWFELYNPSGIAVDLENYYVSDNRLIPTKFKLLSGDSSLIIPPYGFKLFWADGHVVQGNLHTNFSFNNTGEELLLVAPNGITVIDSVSFTNMYNDVSYGRLPNGGPDFTWFVFSTPNMSNHLSDVNENNENILDDLIAYPNPNEEDFIYLNRSSDYLLYDINGRLLGNFTETNKIPSNHLIPGIYLIQNNNFQVVKFIKL